MQLLRKSAILSVRSNNAQRKSRPRTPRMKKLLAAVVVAGVALFGPAQGAEKFQSKPITLVAVFGPGAASDTIALLLAEPLTAALGQTVIVENRPGANGALAGLYVARAEPDGHTLLLATNSPL